MTPERRASFIAYLVNHTIHSMDELTGKSDGQICQLFFSNKKPSPDRIKGRDSRQSVCFTGFPDDHKATLFELAEKNQLRVKSGVSRFLTYLVCGEHPGYKKVQTAKGLNVKIITEDSFLHLLATGESPPNHLPALPPDIGLSNPQKEDEQGEASKVIKFPNLHTKAIAHPGAPESREKAMKNFKLVTSSDGWHTDAFIKSIRGSGSDSRWEYPLAIYFNSYAPEIWNPILSIRTIARYQREDDGKTYKRFDLAQGSLFEFTSAHVPYYGVNKNAEIPAESIYVQCGNNCYGAGWTRGKTYYKAKGRMKSGVIQEEDILDEFIRKWWRRTKGRYVGEDEISFDAQASGLSAESLFDSTYFSSKSDGPIRNPGCIHYTVYNNADASMATHRINYTCTQDAFVWWLITGERITHKATSELLPIIR